VQRQRDRREYAGIENAADEDDMTDIATLLAALRRPKILIRAARAGVCEYQRDRDLKRILRGPKSGHGPQAITTLLAEEDRLESTRKSGSANYSIQRHVAVLTALLAEVRLLPAPVGAAR
jgi:hypothetical protein